MLVLLCIKQTWFMKQMMPYKRNRNNFETLQVFLVVMPHIVEVNLHSQVMMIGHYTASIVAHSHASSMSAVYLDCTLCEPQGHSLLAILIYKIILNLISDIFS